MARKRTPHISRLSGSERSGSVLTPPTPTDVLVNGEVDNHKLAAALRRDRLRLRKSWPAYAEHMGVPLSTLYKIARSKTNPHELTVNAILTRWEELSTVVAAAE